MAETTVDAVLVHVDTMKKNTETYFSSQAEMDEMIRLARVAPALDNDTKKPTGRMIITDQQMPVLDSLKEGAMYNVLMVDEDANVKKNAKGQPYVMQVDGGLLKQALVFSVVHIRDSSDPAFMAYRNNISHGTLEEAKTDKEKHNEALLTKCAEKIFIGFGQFKKLAKLGPVNIIDDAKSTSTNPTVPATPTLPAASKDTPSPAKTSSNAIDALRAISEGDLQLFASLYNPAENATQSSQSTALPKLSNELQAKIAGRKMVAL